MEGEGGEGGGLVVEVGGEELNVREVVGVRVLERVLEF